MFVANIFLSLAQCKTFNPADSMAAATTTTTKNERYDKRPLLMCQYKKLLLWSHLAKKLSVTSSRIDIFNSKPKDDDDGDDNKYGNNANVV